MRKTIRVIRAKNSCYKLKTKLMKKTIFVCAACISIVVVYAQDNRSSIAAPPPQPPVVMIAPPPPPPPPPAMEEAELTAPPAPPMPQTPPTPPSRSKFSTSIIINDNGNEISVRNVKGVDMVFIKKDGKTQKIKLSTWNANRKYYEKKYGKLPPPPPPPLIEEVEFTAPVIKKDS